MTGVTVVVPWRGGCPWRERAWRYLTQWWAQTHPDWQVITTTGADPAGPWCKAAAVTAALPRATGDVLVVADADVACAGIGVAVEAVTSGTARWAVPHSGVYRLSMAATENVYGGAAFPDLSGPHSLLRGYVSEVHKGVAGGGLVVLPRELWDDCPMDARFTGWGQEDLAWGWALTRLHGAPSRGYAPLLHLWHPPQPRASRVAGSTESMGLWQRYRAAYTPDAVRQILNEPGARCGVPGSPE